MRCSVSCKHTYLCSSLTFLFFLPCLSFPITCQNLCIFKLCFNLLHKNFLVLIFSCFKPSLYFVYTHHRTMHSSSDRQTDRQTPRNCISLIFVSSLEPLCSARGSISWTLIELDRFPWFHSPSLPTIHLNNYLIIMALCSYTTSKVTKLFHICFSWTALQGWQDRYYSHFIDMKTEAHRGT